MQAVHARVDLPWEEQDWSSDPAVDHEARLGAFLRADQDRGFDPTRPPLARCALFRLGPDEHQFTWSYHHALLDGWCLPVILNEVFTFYEHLRTGVDVQLPEPRPYRDYIEWAARQDAGEAEAFWRQALDGFTDPTPLPVEPRRTAADPGGPTSAMRHLALSRETSTRVRELARTHHLTLNTVLQAAWALLLSRSTDRSDVVFGATAAGRPPSSWRRVDGRALHHDAARARHGLAE